MIYVITGLPRSGTTLAMKMLEAGGILGHVDESVPLHKALREHPDHERLEKGDNEWIRQCEGMGVKVLMPCNHAVPKDLEYRFIWMDRDAREHAKSTRKFMKHLKQMPDNEIPSIKELVKRHKKYTKKGLKFLHTYPDCAITRVRFEAVLKRPKVQAHLMASFCGLDIDIKAMAGVVLPRSPRCYNGFLELQTSN